MKMIAEDPSLIPMGGKFPFFCFTKLVFRRSGAWNFVILVKDSDTGDPSFIAVRMEYLFACQFLYWELWWKTYEVEKGSIILLIFSCGRGFNVGGWGLVWLIL